MAVNLEFPTKEAKRAHGAIPNPNVVMLDRVSQLNLISEAVSRAAQLGKIEIPVHAIQDVFSLAQYQTGFRNQGDRGTCWAFAGTAALEAAYKRKYGIDVDMSEEYVVHVNKAFEIQKGSYLGSAIENNSSLTGAQGASDIVTKIAIAAIPEEGFAPYLGSNSAMELVVEGLGYSSVGALMNQEDFDAFEYCEEHIPLLSRVNTRYRATETASLGANPSSDAIEQVLLDDHEVVTDVYHKVPNVGGHCLLIIGFDRLRQVFFAKNSWGEGKFIEIQYQNDPSFDITGAAYIKDVADPQPFVQNQNCWLGNWWLNFRGKTGRLLIRRFIDFRDTGNPTKLGNYYAEGQRYEVNGSLRDDGATLDMFIADAPGKLVPGTLQGTEIMARLSFQDIYNARGFATDGTPALLSRYDTRFAGIWVQGVETAWQARHGLSGAQYQSTFNDLVNQGYRPIQVCGYSEGFDARYAAIFSMEQNGAWEARHGLTSADYQATFDNLVQQGYRLRNVSGYAMNGEARYAAIFDQTDSPDWQARHGLNAQQYQQAFDDMVAQGYRLVQVNGYRVNVEVLFAAIWEKRPGPAWQARHGLTSAQYQQTFNDLLSQGYRLVWVSGYSDSGIARYAAIWEQSSDVAWQARHGLNSNVYQLTFDQLVGQGYSLVQVSGYGDGFQ
jgi:hypothetical protein